ncbi:hypothetical protein RA280_47160 [Cupriavidus sp. CV2]|nr:hypothetical protein [Cupriavidus sp. CV2]MDW3689167.1 hypothetical protein [Cupriavidus sp. CV2]
MDYMIVAGHLSSVVVLRPRTTEGVDLNIHLLDAAISGSRHRQHAGGCGL